MNVLYIGDIMGEMGIAVVEKVLPRIKQDRNIDFVVAQAENVSTGKGMTVSDMRRLQTLGIDFFTGGNHTPAKPELTQLLEDENEPVIGPSNMESCPGKGWKVWRTPKGDILVITLLGSTVGREVAKTNPLKAVDSILAETQSHDFIAKIVNFHGDYSSEKVIIGHYLDGRASIIVGDHWHVATADAQVLPKGTAHMSDVGMCGSLDSSLGVTFDSVVPRWRDDIQTANVLEEAGRSQFNALYVELDDGRATKVEHIREIFEQNS